MHPHMGVDAAEPECCPASLEKGGTLLCLQCRRGTIYGSCREGCTHLPYYDGVGEHERETAIKWANDERQLLPIQATSN
jgi:hypothetical protein